MMRYVLTVLLLLPTFASADQNEDTLQRILDDQLAFCVSEQAQFNQVETQASEPIQLKLSDDSIYKIDITTNGKKATVLHTNFSCNNIGYAWCGNGGCTSYVIVDGVSFKTFGHKPFSVRAEDEIEPPPLNWSVPIVRKTENRRWELRDRSLKRLLLS